MPPFRIRPVTRDDAVAVNDLLAAKEAVDHDEEHYTVEDVVEDLENPMIDLDRDWLVAESEDQRLVGQVRLLPRAPADGSLNVLVWGTVHPDHRRRGLGSQLCSLMFERARQYVAERGADLRPVISATARSDNADLAAIVERLGLRPDRWSFVMEADLRSPAPSESVLPEGYTVSTWEGIDHQEALAAHNSAFVDHPGWTPWSHEMWVHWVSGSRTFRPALSLVARDPAGGVAAYVQTSEYDAVAEATGRREAYVAKVGTLPAHRRRGLAGALLGLAMERYRDAGLDFAALDVDSENPSGALGVYERAGFRTTQKWITFRLPSGRDLDDRAS